MLLYHIGMIYSIIMDIWRYRMNGIIVINKEKGYTSRDVVNIACKVLKTKKIGHTGTLDPLATGVLILTIGKATKLGEYLTAKEKEYIATIELGTETDTLDNTGTILREETVDKSVAEIDQVLSSMIGTYLQEVPKYSAVKVNGKKLYEYARNGEEVVLPKKDVTIFSIKRTSDIIYQDGKIKFTIDTMVSKGTYIRSLIRDIAQKLGTIGVMTDLVRNKQGDFTVSNAHSLEALQNGAVEIISIQEILKDELQVTVDDSNAKQIKNGHKVENKYGVEKVLFLDIDGSPIGLYENQENDLRAKIMF